MSATVLTDVQLILGSMELGPFSGEFEIYAQAQMKQALNFAGRGHDIVLPGLTNAYASIKGHADYAVGAVSSTFKSSEAGDQFAFATVPTGSGSVAGDPAFFMRGLLGNMKMLTGANGEVADFEMQMTSDTAGIDGFVGFPLASRGAATGTAVQGGATLATQRIWAALFITAGTFTNLAVTLQSDNAVGFPSTATALTFSTVSAVGWQFISAPGALTDDWHRPVATIGSGTATYAVVFGVY